MKKNHSVSLKRASSLLVFLLLSLPALQAQIKITGTVTDETKETVIGANITVKGTTIGTISDVNGKYSIEVPNQKAILVFSFIGYTTREIPVGKNKVIDVVMKEDGVMLNEVVAIGYGSAKKGDLAGSVAKVDMEELNKTPVASFDQALGGRVAGVQVVSGEVVRVQQQTSLSVVAIRFQTTPTVLRCMLLTVLQPMIPMPLPITRVTSNLWTF